MQTDSSPPTLSWDTRGWVKLRRWVVSTGYQLHFILLFRYERAFSNSRPGKINC